MARERWTAETEDTLYEWCGLEASHSVRRRDHLLAGARLFKRCSTPRPQEFPYAQTRNLAA